MMPRAPFAERRIRRPLPAAAGLAVAVVATIALIAACQTLPPPPQAATAPSGEMAEEASPAEAAEPVDPTEDRVGFPADYRDTFTHFYELDRPDNKSARVIYANAAATSVSPEEFAAAPVEQGRPFPYGSVLVMEVFRTQRDEGDNVVLDEHGRYTRGDLFGVFVMRKEPGFGAKYGHFRNGEWEYTAYRPDGSVLIPPERTGSCAACHVEAGQGRDHVFGAHRAFEATMSTPDENEVLLTDYAFQPAVLTVTVGTTVTWTSKDVVYHTVTARDWAFNSGLLRPDAGFRHTFQTPGDYLYICTIHSNMQGRIVVTEE